MNKFALTLTIVFIIFSIGTLCFDSTVEEDCIKVCANTGDNEIAPWYDDGKIYIFLPSYAELDETEILFDTDKKITLDGIDVQKKLTVNNIQLGESHEISIGSREYTLEVYQSSGVATIYINTATGDMDEVYLDKNHEEPVSVEIIDTDGKVDYESNECTIKGRGNSTWGVDMKPFNLVLSSEAEILGMGASDNWALLANAFDSTALRDKMVKDFAEMLDFQYSPYEEYVDVYLNGEYNGLYMISEKISIEENRLGISEDSVLCSLEFEDRWDNLDNPVMTEAGQTIEVKYPSNFTDKELETVLKHVQIMEDAILGGDTELIAQIIDVDSWARAYLVDEVFENMDSDKASSFFYWSWDDGKIYKGPVWDYNSILGSRLSNGNPSTFYAKREWRSDDTYTPYYNALLQNEDFRERVIEIYNNEFVPLIEDLINNGIGEKAQLIQAASAMNMARWGTLYAEQQKVRRQPTITVEEIINYLKEREDFLNNALNSVMDYKLLYVETMDGSYYIISVVDGENVKLPTPESFGYTDFKYWVYSDTGEIFDESNPITENIKIKAVTGENENSERYSLYDKIIKNKLKLFYAASVGGFLLFMCVFLLTDYKRKGGGTHGKV